MKKILILFLFISIGFTTPTQAYGFFRYDYGFRPYNPPSRQIVTTSYRYNAEEETQLIEIQHAEAEIKEMERRQRDLEDKLDEDEIENDGANNKQKLRYYRQRIHAIRRDIRDAKDDLDRKKESWRSQHNRDQYDVNQQIVYLENNYTYSPNRLIFSNGYILRHNEPIRHRYNHVLTPPQRPVSLQERKEVIQQKQQHINEMKNR